MICFAAENLFDGLFSTLIGSLISLLAGGFVGGIVGYRIGIKNVTKQKQKAGDYSSQLQIGSTNFIQNGDVKNNERR